MNNSARIKTSKFCSFCKRTNHSRNECYHRKRRVKEKQFRTHNTEPHKTHKRGKFVESHNVETNKATDIDKSCEKITVKRPNDVSKSDISSKIELKLKIKRLRNKIEKLLDENKFLRQENLSLSILYFSSNNTPFIDNWKKENNKIDATSVNVSTENNTCL